MITVIAVPFIFIIKERPTKPASALSIGKRPFNFSTDVKFLIKNPSYILLTCSFSFIFGIYLTVGNLVGPLYAFSGYSASKISMVGVIFVLFGVIASMITGVLLDKYKKYLLFLRLICFASTVFIGLLVFTIKASFFLNTVTVALVGFTMVPILPTGYSFAVELTHPTNPALVNGLMIGFGMVFAAVLSIFC